MKKNLFTLLSVLMLASLVLSACAQPTGRPGATQAPAPTQAPAAASTRPLRPQRLGRRR